MNFLMRKLVFDLDEGKQYSVITTNLGNVWAIFSEIGIAVTGTANGGRV